MSLLVYAYRERLIVASFLIVIFKRWLWNRQFWDIWLVRVQWICQFWDALFRPLYIVIYISTCHQTDGTGLQFTGMLLGRSLKIYILTLVTAHSQHVNPDIECWTKYLNTIAFPQVTVYFNVIEWDFYWVSWWLETYFLNLLLFWPPWQPRVTTSKFHHYVSNHPDNQYKFHQVTLKYTVRRAHYLKEYYWNQIFNWTLDIRDITCWGCALTRGSKSRKSTPTSEPPPKMNHLEIFFNW